MDINKNPKKKKKKYHRKNILSFNLLIWKNSQFQYHHQIQSTFQLRNLRAHHP